MSSPVVLITGALTGIGRAAATVTLPASATATKYRRCRNSIPTPMLMKHWSQLNKVCFNGGSPAIQLGDPSYSRAAWRMSHSCPACMVSRSMEVEL